MQEEVYWNTRSMSGRARTREPNAGENVRYIDTFF